MRRSSWRTRSTRATIRRPRTWRIRAVGWVKRSADPTPLRALFCVGSSLTLDPTYEDPHEPVADIGGEQRRAGRPAVSALVGLLAHLRPDAHPQPDARLVLHAGGLFRRHAALAGRELLGRRSPERRGHGADRRADRAFPAAAPGGRATAAGAADAGLLVHHRRCLPDAMDRRPLATGDAGPLAGRLAGGGAVLSALPPRHRGGRRSHRRWA